MKNIFKFVDRKIWKNAQELTLELIKIIQNKLKKNITEKITFQPKFIGSKKTKLITQKNSNPFDFDINLELGSKTKVNDPKKIKILVKKAIPLTVNNHNIIINDYDSGIIKIKVIKNNSIYFKIDLAIIKIENNKLHILKNDSGKWIWNQKNENIDNLKSKISFIKNQGKWNDLRDNYLELKNKFNDSLESYIIYIQVINNIYNQNN